MDFLTPLLSFAGGLISSNSNAEAAEAQRAAENERFQQNLAYQREFAQSGIQWKVADARAAGIHPMAALGANTVSYSPMALGDIGSELKAKSGQDLGRAVTAISPQGDRDKDVNAAVQKLTLERGALENELLKSQIVRIRQGSNPSPPSPAVQASPLGPMFGGAPSPQNPLNNPDQYLQAAPPPEHVGTRLGLGTWEHNPYFSDSQKVEDRYGDVAEEGMGIINLLADLGYNVSRGIAPWTWYEPRRRHLRDQGSMFVSKRYRD